MRLLRSLVPIAALVLQVVVAGRPLPVAASNLFCGADASYVPWDSSHNVPVPAAAATESAIRVVLYTAAAPRANAVVTFITSDSAYQATIAGVAMHASAGGGDYESNPVLVSFPKAVNVQFAYVDSFSLNNAPLTACPSFVNQVEPYGAAFRANTALPSLHRITTTPTMTRLYASVAATMLMALPALSCGVAYTPARMALLPRSDWSVQDEMASYGSGRAGMTTVIAVAITSDGKVYNTTLVQSSGNQITDREALDQARTETYAPAQFLCTPVVSLMFMTFQQK
ncbi:MAG TPA: energy transducer TonB [Candidatus Tyrphobacter sp.]